jgi:YD repeat-containing protein
MSGTATRYQTGYTRDALGRITEKREIIEGNTKTYGYTYDTAGRLTEVKENGTVVSTYAYDANGNRIGHASTSLSTGATGEVDAQDRLTRYGDGSASLTNRAYTYTANGELKTQIDGSGTTTYDYDVLGNLRKAKLPDSTTIEYVIDGQNRRIDRKVNGELKQGFLYQDQLRPIAELDGQNNVTARFVYGDKANGWCQV